MNPTCPTRFRHRKSPSPDCLLGVIPHTPPENLNAVISGDDDDELYEDEVFWTGDFTEPNHHHSNPPSTSTQRSHHHYHFGILAALPENGTRSVFNHKASVSSSSSSSSSSSRMIPVIPKHPLDRPSSVSSVKYPQSAPVNVPLRPNASRRNREFDEVDFDVDDEERKAEMLPPHEIAERGSAHSPLVSCSVLEGVGRTLKGRDLRQVRNAVWRQTGFLD
ncbi:hypothetical protein L1049_014005 [Liquidambar formosana]|uniref:Senescence regulator n=1 Tax=Liquidambar formosana TaxID=63359 RepID=A0AAP0RLD1_LIQFO